VIKLEVPGPDGKAGVIVADGALGRLADLLADRQRPRCLVITDSNVAPHYARDVAERLDAPLFELPAGETHKTWENAALLVRFLLVNGVSRSDLVVAVGGGVVTDIAGFAAAITQRGIPWVACPTTLLGMVDASIGGKTGVNLELGKNLVGSFWPPRQVIIDPLTLRTLGIEQVRNGLAEIIKSAMIAPATLEHQLDRHLIPISEGKLAHAAELIAAAVRVKAEIVSLDEREHGPRKALNLGHTLGHALEAVTGYGHFLHGEAVAWGMLAALRLARDRGLMSTEEGGAWARRVERLAPLPSLAGLHWADMESYLSRDKKRRVGVVGWVLPRQGGVVLDVPVTSLEAHGIFEKLAALPREGPFDSLF
jgi:3-dehydroquinate synthase